MIESLTVTALLMLSILAGGAAAILGMLWKSSTTNERTCGCLITGMLFVSVLVVGFRVLQLVE